MSAVQEDLDELRACNLYSIGLRLGRGRVIRG